MQPSITQTHSKYLVAEVFLQQFADASGDLLCTPPPANVHTVGFLSVLLRLSILCDLVGCFLYFTLKSKRLNAHSQLHLWIHCVSLASQHIPSYAHSATVQEGTQEPGLLR